jgi:hypothetical protein
LWLILSNYRNIFLSFNYNIVCENIVCDAGLNDIQKINFLIIIVFGAVYHTPYRHTFCYLALYGIVTQSLTPPPLNHDVVYGQTLTIYHNFILFQVDIFGKCGPFVCSRNEDRDCLNLMDQNYKFYLRCVCV